MSPLEQIKKGITEQDWTTVCDGYESLTGELLQKWPIESNWAEIALDRIVEIIAKASKDSVMPTPENSEKSTGPKSTKKKRGRPKGSGKKKSKKQSTVTADGEDPSLLLCEVEKTDVQKEVSNTRLITNEPDPEEIEGNKIKAEKAQLNKASLARLPTQMYDVICNECEQPFQTDRPGGELGQKCRSCLKAKKNRAR